MKMIDVILEAGMYLSLLALFYVVGEAVNDAARALVAP